MTTPNDILPLLTKNINFSEGTYKYCNYPDNELWMYGDNIILYIVVGPDDDDPTINTMRFDCGLNGDYYCKLTDKIDTGVIRRFNHERLPWPTISKISYNDVIDFIANQCLLFNQVYFIDQAPSCDFSNFNNTNKDVLAIIKDDDMINDIALRLQELQKDD